MDIQALDEKPTEYEIKNHVSICKVSALDLPSLSWCHYSIQSFYIM